MTLAWCGVRISRVFPGLILLIFFLFQTAQSRQWDSQGASRAFEEARQMRSVIELTPQPTLNQYLGCARTYRKVYLLDPHYGRSGDAIYEEAVIYQKMGEIFSNPEHYKTAVRRFQMLVSEYPRNQNCPDALIRVADIYSNRLKDENAAQDAYRQLRTRYKSSYAAIRKAHPEVETKPALEQTTPSAPLSRIDPAVPASVRNIRYWSTSEYTRVIIEVDSDTPYKKEVLTHPERIYFDIASAQIAKDLGNRTITVEDECLKRIRVAPNGKDVVRVVLDICEESNYSITELHNPFRIVVDLRESKAASNRPPLLQAANARPDEAFPSQASGKPSPEVKSPQLASEPLAQGKTAKDRGSSAPKPAGALPPSPAPAAPGSTAPIADQTAGRAKELPARSEMKPPQAITDLKTAPPKETAKTASSPTVSREKSADTGKADAASKPLPAAGPNVPAIPKAAPPTSRGDRTLTRMLGLKIGRIVIDPGHGGHDEGTIGPGGLMEKDLVLSLARLLKTLLQENLGAEVLLTRDEDVFISLEERTGIANQHRADLFVSIHANSSRIRSISGVETYYLDFAKTDAEREIAARENATSAKNVSDLEDLIKKIAKADKSAESRELASLIQQKLYFGARKLASSTQNRGVRTAPFVVLIGANMPSVLAEVAFISNPKVEKLLKKKANQEALAKALFTGIEGYVNTLGTEIAHIQTDPR